MIRLHAIAEGQTEQAFVQHVLVAHLAQFGVFADARCVLTSKDRRAGKTYRGGLVSYTKAKADILDWIKEDANADCRFTTLFDLYRLPKDFPGYHEAKRAGTAYRRVEILEAALAQDIDDRRFIPYIQLHEFESLIFADPERLDWEYLEHDAAIQRLVNIANKAAPELINDGEETAPSKRILKEIPEYDKAGVAVVGKIGLPVLREKCPHFDAWVTRLEGLGTNGTR